MRHAREFGAAEWAALLPLRQGLRQVRNDLLLARYLRRRAEGQGAFLQSLAHLRGQDVALVIAFEQPWALGWQIEMARRHLPGVALLVFDNSRSAEARLQVAQLCAREGVPCLGLPPYSTRHVNRSHGVAMSWVHANVVAAIEPGSFGFLDHDLVPVGPAAPHLRLREQPVYGLRNAGRNGCWSLWAGYCFFRWQAVARLPLNFLYDFSRELDTGGRNWRPLYSGLDGGRLAFARREQRQVVLPDGESREVEVLDGCWVHIGGISYNNNLQPKFAFYEALRAALAGGARWEALAGPATAAP